MFKKKTFVVEKNKKSERIKKKIERKRFLIKTDILFRMDESLINEFIQITGKN